MTDETFLIVTLAVLAVFCIVMAIISIRGSKR